MIRSLALFALAGAVFLLLASCNSFFEPGDPLTLARLEAKVFKLVNDHRLSIGRTALVWSDVLAAEERTHSQNMATGLVPVGHAGFDERADRVNAIIPWSAIAENVAFAGSAEDAVDAWLKSPDHQVIIEGDYDLTGIGVAKNTLGSFYYFSQMFLKRR
jgi:uncharacterized protein YkwD